MCADLSPVALTEQNKQIKHDPSPLLPSNVHLPRQHPKQATPLCQAFCSSWAHCFIERSVSSPQCI